MVKRVLSRQAIWAVTVVAFFGAAAGVAYAGWSAPADVPGTANDVEAWDAGQLTVSTTQGGYELLSTGVKPRSLTASDAVSTFIDSTGCMMSINAAGAFQATPCAPPASIGFTLNPTRRVRIAPGGYGYTCASDAVTGADLAFSSNAGISNWTKVSAGTAINCGATSALNFNGSSYGLIGQDNAAQTLRLFSDGTSEAIGRAGNFGLPLDTALAGDPTVGLRAFVVDSAGGLYVSELDGGFEGFVQVPAPAAGAAFRSVTVYQTATERFGLAIVELSDGSTQLFSAVPDPSPAAFGTQWVPSTAPPSGLSGVMKFVNCYHADTCGLATNGANTGNASVYQNAQPPLSMPATVSVVAGDSTAVNVPADPDGDAVWVTTTPPAGFTSELDGGQVIVTAPAGLECDGGTPYPFTFSVSDGKAGHETTSQVDVTVLRDLDADPLLAPVLSTSSLTFNAGDPSQTVTAGLDAAECQNFELVWNPLASSGIEVMASADGTSAAVSVPQCVSPATAQFDVIARSAYGDSPPTTLDVTVNGFGAPLEPFVDRIEDQTSGTSFSYSALQTHACNDGGTDVVDVDTRWWLDGGAPASVSFSPALVPGGTLTDTVTVISADACHDEVVQLVAQNEVSGKTSGQGTLTVQLHRDFDPLDGGTFSIASSGGGFDGTADFTGVNCVPERQLSAKYVVEADGTVLDDSAVHPVPGPWSVTPRTSCRPGLVLTIHGELVDAPELQSNPVSVTPLVGDPGLGTLDAGEFLARCEDNAGGGAAVIAEGALHHEPGAAACIGQEVRWSSVDAEAVTFSSPVGDEVTATMRAPRWDELVGRDQRFSAVATAESKASAPAEIMVRVLPGDPFVTARLDTDAPVTGEGGPIGLVATLVNTTACPVEGARWVLTLDGLLPFGEFATVAGVRAPALIAGNTIVVDGISLPPHQPVRVVVSARAALLNAPTALGQVVLGDGPPAAISEVVGLGQGVPETGCGCGAVDGPSVLAAAFGLLAASARRRRRAKRR